MNSNENPHWEFAPTYGGDEDGLSDAYIETYSGDIDRSLAREIIQNSIDARYNLENPVKVVFEKLIMKRNDLPGADDLIQIFESCSQYFSDYKKVVDFFNNAKKIIESDSIAVLKISDYNTTGLRGSDSDKKGEWYNLVKAQGASSKIEGKLGSFGIGKGAPFAASALRVVFYSTFNSNEEHIFQGKARLVSHLFNGKVRKGSGSFGLKHQASIRDLNLIPEFFRRNEQGTDIFIIGYVSEGNEWKLNLIKSVLENFWAAIYNNDLIVQVDNEIFDKNTLNESLTNYFSKEQYDSPYYYYLCYTEPTSYKYEEKLSELGLCKLYIKIFDNAPKKVAMMRQSRMLIKTKHFRSAKPYIGVFICDDKDGNNKLRELEPPQHNDWEPKRKPNGKKIIDELEKWIREKLKSINKTYSSASLDIPELYKYFQLPEDEWVPENENEHYGLKTYDEKTDKETITEASLEKAENLIEVNKKINVPVIIKPSISNSGEKLRKKIKNGQKTGGKYGAGDNEGKIPSFEEINCKMRTYIIGRDENSFTYKLILYPYEDYEGQLRINFATDEGDENFPADLIEVKTDRSDAERLEIDKNCIKKVILKENTKSSFLVKIRTKNKVSLILR